VDPYRALVAALVEIANDILQERVEPTDGAATLAAIGSRLRTLSDELTVFSALDSEWDEHRAIDPKIDSRPEHRAAILQDIVVWADRFRARYGP
jgi:hypothetical protein